MIGMIIPLIITSIILLTLLQPIYVKIIYAYELVIDIDVIFLRIILYPERKQNKYNHNRDDTKRKNELSNSDKISLVRSLFNHSDVYLNLLSFNADDISHFNAPSFGIKVSLVSLLVAYISSESRSFFFNQNNYALKTKNSSKHLQFDLTLAFSLLYAIILLVRLKFKERRYKACQNREWAK